MLQKYKLSKHFIYKWLSEDLYGEFSLHKSPRSQKLTKLILDKIWFVATSYLRPNKIPLSFIRGRRKKYTKFISMFVRPFKKFNYSFKTKNYKLKKLTISKKSKQLWSPKTLIKKTYSFKQGILPLRKRLQKFYNRYWNRLSNKYKYLENNIISRTKRIFYDKKHFFLKFDDKAYTPKVHLVKRSERPILKRYHLLRYFNLISPGDLNSNLTFLHFNSKKNMLSYASKLEFQLSTSLIRAGFIENAYVADHLAKRQLFLVNGQPAVTGMHSLNVWDIVAPSRDSIWWFVYTRFFYFKNVITKSKRLKKRKQRRIPYNYKNVPRSKLFSIILHKYFQETVYLRSCKMWVMGGIPAYLELSYRLLTFIIHRNAYSKDITAPYSASSIKKWAKESWALKRFSILV